MGKLFGACKTNQLKHFFYGSTQDTLDTLKTQLITAYPEIRIAGMYSPPFRALSEEENEQIESIINAAEPDIIWVGLGAPKQEIWMSGKEGKVKGLMIGVGAGFDYFARNIKRAPRWMQQLSLEWLYRLLQEPKRLWKRYLYTNSKFIWLMLKGKLIRR
jgi:N-acetylglucosaminyldiphosphoundecaprenol N-acetyl-beta-D-mannosaminyltransferase